MLQRIQDKSDKIQELLLSIPSLSSNFIYFFQLPEETKRFLLEPISFQFVKYDLTEDAVIEVLDTYSKNFSVKNIDSKCNEIRDWLLENQEENGSWLLALEKKGEEKVEVTNIKNPWANAVCILSLLKFKRYSQLVDKEYDNKISKAVDWLLDTHSGVYIHNDGWKKKIEDSGINIYETGIALRAILKYRSAFKEVLASKISDAAILGIIENILNYAGTNPYWPDITGDAQDSNPKDIGATSYALMTLVHIQNVIDEIDDELNYEMHRKTIDSTKWIINNYKVNLGWKRRDEMSNSCLEVSCYALQALKKCSMFFLSRLRTDENIEVLLSDISKIIISEVIRIQGLLVYRNNHWGWPEDEINGILEKNISITNTAMVSSTLLKCSYKADFKIDLSVILKSMNCLLGSFDKERNTLENTYILCTIMDYLLYRMNNNLIF